MLEVRGLEAGYGQSQILFGMDLTVGKGEVVALLGRNGMGKTTTVRTVVGILPIGAGTIGFEGQPLAGLPAYKIARAGISLVPEGRQIFPNLSVRENLICGGRAGADFGSWSLDRVLALFPRLAERLHQWGNRLSGGEQQMLAIGRALMTNPKLLILDEATEGLAPLIREEIWRCIGELKRDGLSILLIDKTLDRLLPLTDRNYVIEKGRAVWHGSPADFLADDSVRRRYLEIAG
jgi:branched-chain amino acid transport system ATP-binding protein